MHSDDLTVRILIEIRDRLDQTNTRLAQTNVDLNKGLGHLCERIDHVGDRVDQLGDRVTGLELKLSSELMAVNTTLSEVAGVMKGRRQLTERVDRCEQDIADLKRRIS